MTISPKAIDAAIQVLRERDDQFGIRLYANERRAIAEAVMAAAAPHPILRRRASPGIRHLESGRESESPLSNRNVPTGRPAPAR